MNKHRKDLNRNRQQRFVQLLHWEMDSAAYKDLSANARSIYEQIKRRYNGSNNGFIVYSVREAARELKVGTSTAKRAFDELQSHGFIVAEQRGDSGLDRHAKVERGELRVGVERLPRLQREADIIWVYRMCRAQRETQDRGKQESAADVSHRTLASRDTLVHSRAFRRR